MENSRAVSQKLDIHLLCDLLILHQDVYSRDMKLIFTEKPAYNSLVILFIIDKSL